ncbi:MAG: hypothetical protein GX587_10835 [Bacteroidales bacterium]|nr:hypothetical protein [Bacteroidales bacterium]
MLKKQVFFPKKSTFFSSFSIMHFNHIPGHEAIKQRMAQSIRENRISHAQLFIGPEGGAGLAMALAYAQMVNCENPAENDSCGVCNSCQKFSKLIHPDLHFFYPIAKTKEVDAGSDKLSAKLFLQQWRPFISANPFPNLNQWYDHIEIDNKQGIINVNDCNEIIRIVGIKPYEAGYKIVIIWNPEKIFHAAIPKLLKILEEPPSRTLFLLVASDTTQILPTILSRTQMTRIPKYSESEIAAYLTTKSLCSNERALQIAFLSDGNMGNAIDQAAKESDDNATFLKLSDWLRQCYSADIPKWLDFSEEMSKQGREKQKYFLSFALRLFRECLLINSGAETLMRIPKGETEWISKLAKNVISPQKILYLDDLFNKAIYHLERNANPKILFTDLAGQVNLIMRDKYSPN